MSSPSNNIITRSKLNKLRINYSGLPVIPATGLEEATSVMSVSLNQALAKLSLGGLSSFDGESTSVADFLKDLDRNFRMMGLETDQDKLDTLVSCLTTNAKSWYRSPPGDTKKS